MNKIVNNLAQIAGPAEYFDKKTGAAWKIRSCLTNMVVWACNAHLYALKTDSAERIASSMVTVATLRTWVRDSNCNAFTLDLTPTAVAKTLGLDSKVAVHEEALRLARQKCIQTRSASNFKKHYDASIAAFEEQRKVREQSVESIAELISDNEFVPTFEVASHLNTFLGIEAREGVTLTDADLYDESVVERQADQLAEVVGNALEAMYDVCDAELSAAITTDKVSRLTGYFNAIQNMLVVTGVDMKKLAMRRAVLETLIEKQIELVSQSVADIDVEIEKQLAAPVEPEVVAPKKMKRVKSLKQIGELVA